MIAASELTDRPGAVVPLASWYTDLRSEAAEALLTAESEAIRTMADSLPRSLTASAAAAHASERPQGLLRVFQKAA